MNLEDWPERSEKLLNSLGFSYRQPKALTEAILELSSFYQSGQQTTPWKSKSTQAAYLAYFMPLNLFRLHSLFKEAKTLGFFDSLPTEPNIIDFGAGPAVASFALTSQEISKYTAVELHPEARSIYENLQNSKSAATPEGPTSLKRHEFAISWKNKVTDEIFSESSIGLFSYSLNELGSLPDWIDQLQALIILEPSTHQAGRVLLENREKLIAQGFHAWAPCLHQDHCPLLHQSKKDWCHHRIEWPMPEWFSKIDRLLPIKNHTLTYSYLLMSRTPPPAFPKGTFRLTGDLQAEKGKFRIMACRNDQREFLSWLTKEKHRPAVKRGQLLLVKSCEEKQSEIRPGKDYEVLSSLAQQLEL